MDNGVVVVLGCCCGFGNCGNRIELLKLSISAKYNHDVINESVAEIYQLFNEKSIYHEESLKREVIDAAVFKNLEIEVPGIYEFISRDKKLKKKFVDSLIYNILEENVFLINNWVSFPSYPSNKIQVRLAITLKDLYLCLLEIYAYFKQNKRLGPVIFINNFTVMAYEYSEFVACFDDINELVLIMRKLVDDLDAKIYCFSIPKKSWAYKNARIGGLLNSRWRSTPCKFIYLDQEEDKIRLILEDTYIQNVTNLELKHK